MEVTDRIGQPIKVGDRIAYAFRYGDRPCIEVGRIMDVKSVKTWGWVHEAGKAGEYKERPTPQFFIEWEQRTSYGYTTDEDGERKYGSVQHRPTWVRFTERMVVINNVEAN